MCVCVCVCACMHAIEKDKQDLHTYKDKNKDSKRHAFTSLFTLTC